MKQLLSILVCCFFVFTVRSQNKVGIGTISPQRVFHIYDTLGTGFPFMIESRNTANLLTEFNSLGSTSNIGIGMYRSGAPKAYAYVNGSNNYVITMTGAAEHLTITPAGNVGISQPAPGFPLNFASTLGDKIALYGNSGNSYGFGIQSNALQIHTDNAVSDIVFGYGSSAVLAERMRIKGNGMVGIGTNSPIEQLHVYDTANTGYPLFVESNNPSAAMLSVGSRNNTSTVGTSYYRGFPAAYKGQTFLNATNDYQIDLATVGNIFFGKAANGFIGLGTTLPQQNLSVNAGMNIDQANANAGTLTNGLSFGGASGEGIASRKTAGVNQYGLDFYTNFINRFSLTNAGNMGIATNNPGARLQINQVGTWSNSEGANNALEIWDNAETLYMGADEVNNLSYIQAVGNGFVHTLALNQRTGNVAIGKSTATAPLDVAGNIQTSGDLFVQNNKGILRSNGSSPQKVVQFSGPFGTTLAANGIASGVVGFETFPAAPTVFVANVIGISGEYAKVIVTLTNVGTGSCTVNFYNPSSVSITFNATFSFVAIGAQ